MQKVQAVELLAQQKNQLRRSKYELYEYILFRGDDDDDDNKKL